MSDGIGNSFAQKGAIDGAFTTSQDANSDLRGRIEEAPGNRTSKTIAHRDDIPGNRIAFHSFDLAGVNPQVAIEQAMRDFAV